MAFNEAVAEQMRQLLAQHTGVREVRMMGGLCFMVDGNMCCGVTGCSVMVRVGSMAYPTLLAQPHVRPLEFAGRRPKGFVVVDPDGWSGAPNLQIWVQRGLDFVAKLPVKPAPAARSGLRRVR